MADHTKTRTPRTRRHTAAPRPEGDASPTYKQLAADALLADMTREQVVAQLVSRIKRDQGYLAYRKACNRRTNYDDQVQQDMLALALAACWLAEGVADVPRASDASVAIGPDQLHHQHAAAPSSSKAHEEGAANPNPVHDVCGLVHDEVDAGTQRRGKY